MSPEELDSFLASTAGQSLGAGQYRALQSVWQNAYNNRANDIGEQVEALRMSDNAPATNRDWSARINQMYADHAGGTPQRVGFGVRPVGPGMRGPMDEVYTGNGEMKIPHDPTVAGLVPNVMQRFFASPNPGYMRMGDDVYLGGQQLPAGYENVNPGLLRQAAAPAPVPMEQRVASLQRAFETDPTLSRLSGLQRSNLFTQAVGIDPLAYQDRNMKAAMELHKAKMEAGKFGMEQSKALRDEYEGFGKSQYGMPTADVLSSAGFNYINPATGEGMPKGAPGGQHVYSVFRAGEDVYDPGTGAVVGKKPGRFIGAHQGDIRRLQQIRQSLGMDDTQESMAQRQAQLDMTNREIAVEEARRALQQPASAANMPPAMGDRRLLDEAGMQNFDNSPQAQLERARRATEAARAAKMAEYYARPRSEFDFGTAYMP